MARPIWKGHISFGLVNVPITLYSAEHRTDLSFHMVDTRNAARVRYERVNEATGEEVPWDKIVKGYEYDGGSYVLLTEEELERAQPELTKTIDIEEFVDLDEIGPMYFDRPYYLVPAKGGEKGYVLLREALAESKKVGIARVVIRARGHIAALLPQGNALVLSLLRYAQELRNMDEYDFPSAGLKGHKVSRKEVDLAKQLIEGMTDRWDPNEFHDEYRDALMKLIRKRIEAGQTEEVEEVEEVQETPRTVNFMAMLKKSMEQSGAKGAKPATRARSAARSTHRRSRRTSQKAG
jgi:DNA end-binding protein Ku